MPEAGSLCAQVLELQRLSGPNRQIECSSSIDRQCHTYALTERLNKRSLPLKRIFTRYCPAQCCCALGSCTWHAWCAGQADAGAQEVTSTSNCASWVWQLLAL